MSDEQDAAAFTLATWNRRAEITNNATEHARNVYRTFAQSLHVLRCACVHGVHEQRVFAHDVESLELADPHHAFRRGRLLGDSARTRYDDVKPICLSALFANNLALLVYTVLHGGQDLLGRGRVEVRKGHRLGEGLRLAYFAAGSDTVLRVTALPGSALRVLLM